MTDQFVGPYRVLEKLGAGGMGEVFLADDTRLGRKVALKKPSEAWLAMPESRARLHREASAAALLTHPNIAAVYDVLDVGTDPYIVMEYVEGEPLSSVLRRGAMPVEQVVHVGIQLADALAAAHARGVVHRDIKPGNVCVTPEGQVKVLDFGLAIARRPSGALDAGARITAPGQVLGTPGYSSPEHLAGAPASPGDDIYGAGVLLFELLTGRRPFEEADAVGLAVAAMTQRAPAVDELNPSVPRELSALVARMLARDPRDRVASATEVRAELRRIAAAYATSSTGVLPAPRRRRRRAVAVAAVIAVPGLAALLLAFLRIADPPVKAEPVPTVAVLPFENRTADPRDESIASGIRDVLIANLGGQPGINVLSRGAVADQGADAEPARLGRRLGATFLVHGSLQRSGDELMVAVRLERAGSAVAAWGSTFSAPEQDVFLLQRRIAEGLSDAPPLRAAAGGARRSATAGTHDVEALGQYGQAVAFLERPDIPGNLQRAEQLLRAALDRDGKFALAWARLGETYWALFEQTRETDWTDRALSAINEALRLDPDQAVVRISLARVYHGRGRSDVAIEELRKALELQPSSDDAHRLLGQVFQQAGRTQDAADQYRKAIELRPNFWRHYNTLGALHYQAGQLDDAVEAFTRVTELQPDNPWGYQNLGTVYYTLGAREEALEQLARAIAISPMADTYSTIGTIQYDQGRFKAAAESFRQAIALAPNDGLLHGNLGDALTRLDAKALARQSYLEAVRLEQQVLSVNPNDVTTLARLAVHQAKLGRYAEAGRTVDRALGLRPADGEVLYRSAVVRALAGDTETALAYLEQALTHGYSAALARADHDLAAIRGTPRFRDLVGTE